MKLILTSWEMVLAVVFLLGDVAVIVLAVYLFTIRFVQSAIRAFLGRPTWTTMSEFYFTLYSTPIPSLIELSLRTQVGKPISRILGSPWRHAGLTDLSFSPAQVARRPLAEGTRVDTATTIGPLAAKPLTLAIPILLSAMGYNIALTKEAKLALAHAATAAGTATNSGESGFFQPERDAASHYIVQVKADAPSFDPVAIGGADAVEIHLGQGAQATVSYPGPRTDLHNRQLAAGQLPGLLAGDGSGEGAERVVPAPPTEDLAGRVRLLRQLSGGAPVGVKILPSDLLEEDLAAVVAAGVDYVALDGAGAGTAHTVPVLADAFGIDIATAVPRAVAFLQGMGARRRVTLIAAGGLRDPADFLKVMALGADAVYIGTAAVMALAHPCIQKTSLYIPPSKFLWSGFPATNRRLRVDASAQAVANFLEACRQEMVLAARALGLSSLHALTPAHLCALNPETSRATGVPLVREPGRPTEVIVR